MGRDCRAAALAFAQRRFLFDPSEESNSTADAVGKQQSSGLLFSARVLDH